MAAQIRLLSTAEAQPVKDKRGMTRTALTPHLFDFENPAEIIAMKKAFSILRRKMCTKDEITQDLAEQGVSIEDSEKALERLAERNRIYIDPRGCMHAF